MKKIIDYIVEILFEQIPFSKKAEDLKHSIIRSLESQYKQDTNDNISVLESIMGHCHNIYDAGKLAGYKKEELGQIADTSDLCDLKSLQAITKKSRRFKISESLFIALIISSIISIICNLNLYSIIYNCSIIVLMAGLAAFMHKKEDKFKKKTNLSEIKCDNSGKEYIKSMYDKYLKKEINMIFFCFLFAAYIIFTNLFSVFSSAFNIGDILRQISTCITIICITIFLTAKNAKCLKLFSNFFVDEREKKLQIYIKKILIFSAVYYTSSIICILLLRNIITYSFNLFLAVSAIYLILLLIQNLSYRKDFTFKNIVINPKRITAVSLAVILLLTYHTMSMDGWFTQSYINRVPFATRTSDNINYNDENGVYTITTVKDEFKVLQLTDIHLGGSAFSVSKDLKALKAIEKLINASNPDLVIVTGDLVFPMGIMSFSLNNRAPVMQFASFMRNIGIPWAFTYGNHDTETLSVINDEQFDGLMKSLSFRNSRNLLYPYIQPDIYGRSNQLIEIRHQDGKLMQALFLLDSNDYISNGKINEYDYIHDDQTAWYEKQVKKLCQSEGYTIPSMLFFHMPLQEYKEAYELYENGSTEVKYFYGKIGETMIDKICCSKYQSRLFDTAKKLGSTKAMFCGHDHYNNLSVEYQGIRLTYGYSIDYLAMPGIENHTEQRGATLITIDRNGEYAIEPYILADLG